MELSLPGSGIALSLFKAVYYRISGKQTEMKTSIRIFLILSMSVLVLGLFGCRYSRRSNPFVKDLSNDSSLRFEHLAEVTKDSDADREDNIHVFHHWREIDEGDYFFEVPSAKRVEEWKALCEERNPLDSASRGFIEGSYADMNQFVTVGDFIQLWYHDDSRIRDDELTTWRLMQYDSLSFSSPDSEYDKFARIRNVYLDLLCFDAQSQWEMNFQSGLEADFQEYYDRILVREAIRHSALAVAAALREEENSWLRYHTAVDSAYCVIGGSPHGMVGSAWPMAISGILLDDACMREYSLADFYFALTDKLDYEFAHKRSKIGEYDIERHERVSDEDVFQEYAAFKRFLSDSTFFDPERHYPEQMLRSALDKEMRAWSGWMSSRRRVSSLLTGLCKDVYDNSTNNVRRYKLIMLKNRYQEYGLISEDTNRCLLPHDCNDADIAPFSFEQRWNGL